MYILKLRCWKQFQSVQQKQFWNQAFWGRTLWQCKWVISIALCTSEALKVLYNVTTSKQNCAKFTGIFDKITIYIGPDHQQSNLSLCLTNTVTLKKMQPKSRIYSNKIQFLDLINARRKLRAYLLNWTLYIWKEKSVTKSSTQVHLSLKGLACKASFTNLKQRNIIKRKY